MNLSQCGPVELLILFIHNLCYEGHGVYRCSDRSWFPFVICVDVNRMSDAI